MKTLMTKDEVKAIVNQCVQAKMTPEHIEMYFDSNSDLSPSDWLVSPDRDMSTDDYIKVMNGEEPAPHTFVKL